VRTFRSAVVCLHDTRCEPTLDERVGRTRTDARPDDGQEVLSKLRV